MTTKYFSSKKANLIGDSLIVFIMLFFLSIIGIAGYLVINTIYTETAEIFTDPIAKESIEFTNESHPSLFDGLVISLLAIFWVGTIILAFFIDSHPAFFVLAIILSIILIICVAVIGNTYQEINTELGYENYFPMTTFLFNNLVLFVMAYIISVSLSLFGKYASG